jgi:hypothetical protein
MWRESFSSIIFHLYLQSKRKKSDQNLLSSNFKTQSQNLTKKQKKGISCCCELNWTSNPVFVSFYLLKI